MTASEAFRTAVYQPLNGQITADFDGSGSVLEIYDQQVTTRQDDLYILLSTEQSTDISNKSTHGEQLSLLIEITHRPDYAVDSRVLDDIEGQVRAILKPTPQTNGLAQQTGWQLICFKVESGNKLNMAISSTQSINRKLLTLSCRAYQLN